MYKFSDFFNENMTEEDARSRYWKLMDEIPWGAAAEIEELEEAYLPVRDKIMERENPVNQYSKYFSEDMSSDQARGQYFSLAAEIRKKGGTEADREELNKAYYPVSRKIVDRDFTLVCKGWIVD